MPMGLISDEEFEKQYNNVTQRKDTKEPVVIPTAVDTPTTNAIEGEVVDMPQRGRGIGSVNVPATLRSLIAGTAAIEGRPEALKLAADFGISNSSVAAYSKGAHSAATYDKPDASIIEFVKARKARVTKKALRVMTASLDKLTSEKLDTANAKELSGIAKDMSSIIGNFSDVTQVNENTGPTFVLYAPQVMEEKSYVPILATE